MKKTILISFSMLFFSSMVHAKLLSAYTSVDSKDCVTYQESDDSSEIDFYTGECAGLGGYQVIVSGGDIRYDLSLKKDGQEIKLSNYSGFHDLGSDKIEWLYERSTENAVIYKALIHKLSINIYDESTGEQKDEEVLLVSKLNGTNSCTVAEVKKSPRMNELAREIAEKAENMSCLDLGHLVLNISHLHDFKSTAGNFFESH